jgi:hypothetical protein
MSKPDFHVFHDVSTFGMHLSVSATPEMSSPCRNYPGAIIVSDVVDENEVLTTTMLRHFADRTGNGTFNALSGTRRFRDPRIFGHLPDPISRN